MESRLQNSHTPLFDPNALDEKFEIVFEYDDNGHLKRIKKIRHYEFHPANHFVFAIVIIIFFIYIFKNYGLH